MPSLRLSQKRNRLTVPKSIWTYADPPVSADEEVVPVCSPCEAGVGDGGGEVGALVPAVGLGVVHLSGGDGAAGDLRFTISFRDSPV